MKKRKAVTVLLTVGLMASAVLVGCGDSPGAAGGTGQESKAESASAESPGGAKSSGTAVSLELVVGDSVNLPDKENNFIEQQILEDIGVDVNMNILGGGGDYATALNARISGGDIPDMFRVPSTDALNQYIENGIVLCLDDYEEQLRPLIDWVGGEEAALPNRVDGKLYRVPKRPQGTYDLILVRQDWLDKVGADMPSTVDEALEVAKKLTFEDPDGNGTQDTYGFSGWGLGGFDTILNAYGGSVGNNIYLKDGKLTSTILAPDMKEGLEMCKAFVDAGVVDPDIVANNEETIRDKMAQCKLGMLRFSWAGVYKQAWYEQVTAVDPNADWVWMEPWAASEGNKSFLIYSTAVGTMGPWVVSAKVAENPEKLDAVIKLLNYVVSDQGLDLVCYGVEGRHYNIEDGKIVKTDLMSSECDYVWLYQIALRDEVEYLSIKFPEEEASIHAAMDTERLTTYNDAVIMPPDFHLEDMNKYIDENMTAFIFGTRPISEYDQFIKELNTSFGFDEYMKMAEEQLRAQGYMK